MPPSSNKPKLKALIIATRPWSFTASVMPALVMWGILCFYHHSEHIDVNWITSLLCLPLLVFVHAGGNMVSDYFDYTRHVDLPSCPNGVTWIHDGTFQPRQILRLGIMLILIGTAIGVALLCQTSWSAIWIGIVGLLMAFCYFPMKAHGLGDVNVLVSFALLPAIGIAFVATGTYMFQTMLLILPPGLLTVSILHANNTRDIHNDSRAGLHTLCNSLSPKTDKAIYGVLVLSPYVLSVMFWLFARQPVTLLIVFITLPIAIRALRQMLGANNNMVDQIPTLDRTSAQLQTLFSLLYAAAYFIAAIL